MAATNATAVCGFRVSSQLSEKSENRVCFRHAPLDERVAAPALGRAFNEAAPSCPRSLAPSLLCSLLFLFLLLLFSEH